MRQKIAFLAQFIPVLALCLVFALPQSALAVTNTQLALSNSGSQANLVSDTGFEMTASGRYLAFGSDASYIVSGDTNGKRDVFVRDTVNGSTAMASVSSSGVEGNDDSATLAKPVITNNGRYVLFSSKASNLATVTGIPVGGSYDVGLYLHDMKTGSTTLIAAGYQNMSGTQSYVGDAMSEDARFIYYSMTPPAGQWHLYVLDRVLNTTTQIDTSVSGVSADIGSDELAATTSCDGRFVAFHSSATNLVSGDTNGVHDIFLVDSMGTHTIKEITLGGNGDSVHPVVSCDGNYVLYNSDASNLVSGDTNSSDDVFLYDVANDSTERVSLDNGNAQFSQDSGDGSISADGRYVTFNSAIGTTYTHEIYVHDRQTGDTTLVSQDSNNQMANQNSFNSRITADGRTIYYTSFADNLGVTNPSHAKYLYRATDLF